MYIDKDSWGKFSVNDLSEKDLRLLHEALKMYVQQNLGRIHPADGARIFRFDCEYSQVLHPDGKSKGAGMERMLDVKHNT
ncbi:ornithine aminotransferase [Prevotella sp. HUN102]|uniref:ornithine aminotransferase n=1 Tax=Prevotella sp. HUN102 TaxID=1392486 RepID=UPI000AE9605F|nr:ornithine aminotransferase [Prevotella sp. HUN102]